MSLADGERREDLQLVMQPRYTLRGRLVSSRGGALAGWRIDVRGSSASSTARTTAPSLGRGDRERGDDRRRTFVVHMSPAGATTISAFDPARPPDADAVVVKDVTLTGPGAAIDAGDVATP